MTAERFRMDVISTNIANANSMSVGGQEAYRRRDVELSGGEDGVKIMRIVEDKSPLRQVLDPTNPNRDAGGYVYYSNVNPIQEMVSMLGASRSYEANIAAFNSAKTMVRAALNIGKV
jgi:flagellar basal-body rod protein FlgC